MSEESKCGIFWMMHCENSLSFVWSSSIELWIDSMFDSTVVRHVVKNSRAKDADPTGCPRSRNPERSSTGVGGSEADDGCGSAENRAIVSMTSVASCRLRCRSVGRGEFPLHEVSIRVLNGLMKHPTWSPFRLSVSHRNWRSGR